MGILFVVFSGFLLALGTPWLTTYTGRATGWVYALLPAAITAYLASLAGRVAAGPPLRASYPWVPGLDVHLSFYIDGLSLLFALLVSGIGTLIFIYGGGYLKGHHHLGRFFSYLSMFMASMLGLVLSDNLITFYVFFELTSFASFMLIGFNHDEAPSRRAAWQALLVTKGGGLALLVGFLLMGEVGGTYQISALLDSGDLLREHPYYTAIVLLVMAGAFTKSAQFPFYFWLPNAMEAPTPVSAYLHSATMVKAGIYAMARFYPVLGDTPLWMGLLGGVGALTMVVSAWLALQYTDMKAILAYTTIMALGLLTMLLGLGGEAAITACIVFILVHAFYKAALFMVVGAVDHEVHVRDFTRLGGLWQQMPITGAAAALAGLSMAGIPPFFGFVGKELIYEATTHFEPAIIAATAASVLANVALVAAAGLLVLRPFWGPPTDVTEHAHRPAAGLWVGPAVLAVLSLGLGLVPGVLDTMVLAPSAGAVLGASVAPHLALWHGLTPALGLSAVTLAAGVGTYVFSLRLRRLTAFQQFERWLGTGLDNGYDHVIDGLIAVGRWQTRLLQNGVLRRYLMTVLVTTIALVGMTFYRYGFFGGPVAVSSVRSYEWILAVLAVGGAAGTLFFSRRMAMITSLGVSGFSIAMLFLVFGAPDLAKTQFLIETLSVILVVLILTAVSRMTEPMPRSQKLVNGIVAAGMGVTVAGIVLAVLTQPFENVMGSYYAHNSYILGEGRNIVNTILVDFRALDTLGEITVLLIAGYGIYALLRLGTAPDPNEEETRAETHGPGPDPSASAQRESPEQTPKVS
jgi:multicomponent Na+:H+ antiporter subunit A